MNAADPRSTKGRWVAVSLGMLTIFMLVPAVVLFFPKDEQPDAFGFISAFMLIISTLLKFAIGDALSDDGFNLEKTATGVALALWVVLFTLAVKQQLDDEITRFAAGGPRLVRFLLGQHIWPGNARANTRGALWIAAAFAMSMTVCSFGLARRAYLRKDEPQRSRGLTLLFKSASVVCASLCYTLYFAVTLLKG